MSTLLRSTTALARLTARRCSASAARFARDESGVLAVPAIVFIFLMLMVGGIGIDLMWMERDRTRLQYTLDRAVLAAADLDQPLPAEEVVEDYLIKAGLGEYYTAPEVSPPQLGYKSVKASINTTYDTTYLHLAGVDELPLVASARAEEAIGAVEISMVLDISGSMSSNDRLNNLKIAARSFIDQITASTDTSNLSISIVPYATQVNAGEALLGKFTNADFDGLTKDEWNYSHCINFIKDQFSKHTLNSDEPMERTAHFDTFTYSEGPITFPVCPTRDGSQILPLSNDAAELKAHINKLTAAGNTSIDIGMKWGSALLDPSVRNVVAALADDGVIDSEFAARPTDYGSGDALKIIILMSDGENTNQYMLNPSRRTGMSDVWYNASEDRYSVYHSNGTKNYYWPHNGTWNSEPYGNGMIETCDWVYSGYSWNYSCSETDQLGTAVQLTYPELFAQASLAYIAEYIYTYSSSAWSDWFYAGRYFHNRVAKDQHTKHICDITKDQGVMVYAVGFEAPRNGTRVLKDCASSPAHFFDVDGLEISDAFSSIATSIRQLRLTQ